MVTWTRVVMKDTDPSAVWDAGFGHELHVKGGERGGGGRHPGSWPG